MPRINTKILSHRRARIIPPPKLLRKKIQAIPPHRAAAQKNSFGFRWVAGWSYGHNQIVYEKPKHKLLIEKNNQLVEDTEAMLHKCHPHIALFDAQGRARFTLGFERSKGEIRILDIQRVRTEKAYKRFENGDLAYYPKEETRLMKAFGKKLGMHPGSFLISEFLSKNRDIIKGTIDGKPKKVRLYVHTFDPENMRNYGGYIDRFFKRGSKKHIYENGAYNRYDLSMDKQIVKKSLCLE